MTDKYCGVICEVCLRCAAKYRVELKYYCEVCAIMEGIFNNNPNLFKNPPLRRDRRHKYFMAKTIQRESSNGRIKW